MADEKLQIVRHSCAHVMAEAILNLYPGTKIAIGPAIDNGFYYDFDFPEGTKFTETDFPAVEKEMRKILAGNHEFIRKEVSKEEAQKFADTYHFPYFEASALTGEGVMEAFSALIEKVYEQNKK